MSDIEQIQKALKKAKLPKWVVDARIETMVDHSGEPAVRVTLVVKNADEKMLEDGDALNVVARQVHLAIDAAGVVRWPYTDFVVAREAA